jgi:hypothetical protein
MQGRGRAAPRLLAAAIGLVVFVSCRHTSESATFPGGPTSATGSPAAPSPAPVSPAPPPAPVAQGCALPPGGGSGAGCPYLGSAFGGDVDLAIEQAQKEHPELFDFSNGYGGLS